MYEAVFLVTPIVCQYIVATSLPLPQELTEHMKPGQRNFSDRHTPLSSSVPLSCSYIQEETTFSSGFLCLSWFSIAFLLILPKYFQKVQAKPNSFIV